MNKKSLTLALLAAMSVHAGFATCGVCNNVKALAQKSINSVMAHKYYILGAAAVLGVAAVVYKSDYLLKKIKSLLGKETKVKRVRPVPYRSVLKDICPCETEDEDVCETKVRSCGDVCPCETEETE